MDAKNAGDDRYRINDLEALESLYGAPAPTSLSKVSQVITPLYKQWIEASKFLVLSTAGATATDGSPRGDDEEVVRVVDRNTVWLPDWKGNNRIDSLRNIVETGQVSLMFMVGGSDNVVRINGHAYLSIDESIAATFSKKGVLPKSVIVITVSEIYFQCAKALMRSKLWKSGVEKNTTVPTAGKFLQEADSAFDGEPYDAGYADYAKSRMW